MEPMIARTEKSPTKVRKRMVGEWRRVWRW